MATVTLISGCPGVGKSTVAAQLARESRRGVHLESDLFYDFIVDRILQVLPESAQQNRTVIKSFARAADAYAAEGYDVFVDGVVGPWFIPVFQEGLGTRPFDYVILMAPLEVALARSNSRHDPGHPEVVRHMHAEFVKPSNFGHHIVDTGSLGVDETVAEVRRRLRTGSMSVGGVDTSGQ